MVELPTHNRLVAGSNPVVGHQNTFQYKRGDRIAQAMLIPVPVVEFEEVEDVEDTERGDGGFGSSGK